MGRTERIWEIAKKNETLVQIISGKLGILPVTAQILVNRGFFTADEARAFLYGDLSHQHSPFLMKDMDKAVKRIQRALENREKILVYGDYDTDGVTSTTLLVKYFRSLGAPVDYYIPHRTEEGYGLHKEALEKIACQGFGLVITVDCGITAVEEVEFAASLGVDVIITDHHEVPEEVPRAVAVINPKQEDCRYPFRELAGVGVAFKLVQALEMKRAGDGAGQSGLGVEEAGLEYLDLVTLGTIADVVPLRGENRIFVRHGLDLLAKTASEGIKALLEVAGWQGGEVSARQVGFGLAPRINAAGRLGDARPCVELLLTGDSLKAHALATELHRINEERQNLEAGILQEAIEKIALEIDFDEEKAIVLASEKWHPGVLGIVASRLAERYYRPVVLLSIEGDDAKGSARSIPAFHMYEALQHCEKYVTRFGGHRQAAGLSLPAADIPAFARAFGDYARDMLAPEDLAPRMHLDGEVRFYDLTEKLWQELNMLAPFGAENPGPVLACRNASVIQCRPVGNGGKHLKLAVAGERLKFDAIGFNMGERASDLAPRKAVDLAFALEKNEWQGRTTLQLRLEDIKEAGAGESIDAGRKSNAVSGVGSGGSGVGCAGSAVAGARNGSARADCENAGIESGTAFIDDLFARAAEFLGDDYYRNVGEKEEFFTKIAGVSFEGRQEVAASLKEGEELQLVRDHENPHDPNAVRVQTRAGVQVGFLNRKLAKHFAPLLDEGEKYSIFVTSVTGGGDRHYGVNVLIQKKDAGKIYEEDLCKARAHLAALGDDELRETIRELLLGPHPYRPKQREAMESVFEGRNTLAIFGTGRGKSVVFQTVAAWKVLREGKITVIIYPLRALVNDQYEAMVNKLSPAGISIMKANGSLSTLERTRLFAALEDTAGYAVAGRDATVDILLTTPEFIEYHWDKFNAIKEKIGFFVVDEAHHIGMSSLSHRPVYRRLGQILEGLGRPTVLAVTATAGEETAGEIKTALDIEKVIIDPHVRTNLQIVDKRDYYNKNDYVRQVVETGAKTVIYVNSRTQTVEIANFLRETAPGMKDKIIYYHAGLSNKQRETIEKMFRAGEVSCVVSTSAFGEGIDIPDIAHVILFHLNFNFTDFNQQSGRAGRDGKTAQIHLLFGKRDASINDFILEGQAPDRDMLAKLYFLLKQLGQKENPLTVTNGELAEGLHKMGLKDARDNTVSTSLGILEELGLIERERDGGDRFIYILPSPADKIDLDQSLRYLEGLEEKMAFEDFSKTVFAARTDELLEQINRPIYPAHELEDDDDAADNRQINCQGDKL